MTTDSNGLVFNIQSYSIHDGPGIRTTVFFKGCPLKCQWCHNPESIKPLPEIGYHESRCIKCHKCIEVCPREALSKSQNGIVINREGCDGCGKCAEICYSGALELFLGLPIGRVRWYPEQCVCLPHEPLRKSRQRNWLGLKVLLRKQLGLR